MVLPCLAVSSGQRWGTAEMNAIEGLASVVDRLFSDIQVLLARVWEEEVNDHNQRSFLGHRVIDEAGVNLLGGHPRQANHR